MNYRCSFSHQIKKYTCIYKGREEVKVKYTQKMFYTFYIELNYDFTSLPLKQMNIKIIKTILNLHVLLFIFIEYFRTFIKYELFPQTAVCTFLICASLKGNGKWMHVILFHDRLSLILFQQKVNL